MPTSTQLVHSRARVRSRYALFPLAGYPPSRLPAWEKTEAFVLAAPALGAQFVQYLLKIDSGGGTRHSADNRIETFLYVISGSIELELTNRASHHLASGGFGLVPINLGFSVRADEPSQILLLRKVFERAEGIALPPPVIGSESKIAATAWMNNEHARLQTLIPDELQFDLAMNIFTFEPGHGLPYVETHVMEHGLYILQGKGMYYLQGDWLEVEAGDFIWMGPYCPQSYYAAGSTPTKYIYYKNVNREIPL